MSNTYKRAIAVASDLVEGVDLTNAANREYTRGIVEFMADFFPQSASYMDERKAKVARDLAIDPEAMTDDALDIIKEALGGGEFRRGYLHGQREMQLRVENALSSLRVEEG